MRKTNFLAVAILVLGAVASFVCYMRLAQLLPMGDPAAVTHAEGKVISVQTPMVQKGGAGSDVVSQVQFSFVVADKPYIGGYSMRGREALPVAGEAQKVVYYTKHPLIFVRAEEYADLPRQIAALRVMLWGFALAAVVLPFVVLGMAMKAKK